MQTHNEKHKECEKHDAKKDLKETLVNNKRTKKLRGLPRLMSWGCWLQVTAIFQHSTYARE